MLNISIVTEVCQRMCRLLNYSIFELPAKNKRSIFERSIVAEGTDSNSLEFTKLQSLFLHAYLIVNLVISVLVLFCFDRKHNFFELF